MDKEDPLYQMAAQFAAATSPTPRQLLRDMHDATQAQPRDAATVAHLTTKLIHYLLLLSHSSEPDCAAVGLMCHYIGEFIMNAPKEQ